MYVGSRLRQVTSPLGLTNRFPASAGSQQIAWDSGCSYDIPTISICGRVYDVFFPCVSSYAYPYCPAERTRTLQRNDSIAKYRGRICRDCMRRSPNKVVPLMIVRKPRAQPPIV